MLLSARQSRRLRYLLRPTTERVVILGALVVLVIVMLGVSGQMAALP